MDTLVVVHELAYNTSLLFTLSVILFVVCMAGGSAILAKALNR